jgi:hypothetical protein
MPAAFEKGQLTTTVDLQIGHWISHALAVGDLTGQAEDQLLAADQGLHAVSIAHIRKINPYLVCNRIDVLRGCPIRGKHRIDD